MARAQALLPSDLGHWSSAFYGPRAEAPLVGVVAPVVPVDATAMYSLVSGLLETWALLRAASIRKEDVTRPVRSVLARPDLLALCFQGRFWREHIGVTLVELEDIEGSVLPVRARFDPQAADPRLAVTPFFYDGRLWYTLPDVIASVLLSGIVQRVRRAIRLHGAGHQAGLREVRLRRPRERAPAHPAGCVARAGGPRARAGHVQDPREHARLRQPCRVDRREFIRPLGLVVHGPDKKARFVRPLIAEDPGLLSFPPVAASVTAGARLMLAMLDGS